MSGFKFWIQGYDDYRNAMFIYDVVTGRIPVEYKQLFEEY